MTTTCAPCTARYDAEDAELAALIRLPDVYRTSAQDDRMQAIVCGQYDWARTGHLEGCGAACAPPRAQAAGAAGRGAA